MGRKKSRPIRSGGIQPDIILSNGAKGDRNAVKNAEIDALNVNATDENALPRHFFVEIDSSHCESDEHFDIAEIILRDIRVNEEYVLLGDPSETSNIYLRFKIPYEDFGKFKFGYAPVLSADTVYLEFIKVDENSSDNTDAHKTLFSGTLDGPGESLSGLVHLVSLKFMTLRLLSPLRLLGEVPSIRLRVEILRNAFEACESLTEVIRKPWRKSMVNVMAWLRPEVTTSEVKYGIDSSNYQIDVALEADAEGMATCPIFDAAGFYEAIRPSKDDPMLDDDLPELVPQLRPYQRRAAYWMIQRERGLSVSSDKGMERPCLSPFCVPVPLLDGTLMMFYNPFGGNVSLHSDSSSSYVPGGILADEMGLGKTVELLACVLAQRRVYPQDCIISDEKTQDSRGSIRRLKKERVECVCGAVAESIKYKGLWVQCDSCDAWQHADCVGYSPNKNSTCSLENSSSITVGRNSRQHGSITLMQTNESYICSLCSELIEATNSVITTHATLIVCPSPILMQWHSELIRHTKPGFLKIHIYEGAKRLSLSADLRTYVNELLSSDIVLTTYDVLKEDLSHDSDRHEGDRRCMRFQKRYPVVPTLLTRILWWRLCLDEAQMVESNTATATEMALRLHAQYRWCITGTPIQRSIDDLFGLLRFLRASPFDIFKWWTDVIRDPYERKDVAAMNFTHNFFKKILWRSSKVHVSDELQLPPQQECASWLNFSPIEEHFYQKQHETCTRDALQAVERFKKDLNNVGDSLLSHVNATKLLAPLLKLRQACCHPQVGSSGLRSLQQSPMTMDEILEVLIGKAKVEGEEALRKVIIALNGLAGIACIAKDYRQASFLYREALSIAEGHSDDFCVDPLLSIHVHHNLADLLPLIPEFSRQNVSSESYAKKQKRNEGTNLELMDVYDEEKVESAVDSKVSHQLFDDHHLRKICEDMIQKYMSIFFSKLSFARQEYLSAYTQVCDLSKVFSDLNVDWWFEALNLIEKNKDSSDELMRKIDLAVSRAVNNSGTSRVSSRCQSISGLKLIIQSGLDSLVTSRQTLITRLADIDKNMENPKEADILRVRFCPSCQSGNGSLCVHCELNDLFQEYEARLFHLKKGNYMMASAEEAIDSRKRKNNLNLFFRDSKNFANHGADDSENKGQRNSSTNVVVYRLPSDLELILGVIKRHSKSLLGGLGSSSARKHLLLFEAMRKEFPQLRSLSTAQARVLSAHDELKMSTSRLRLRENEDEPTAVNVLSPDQLIQSSMQYSSDKFLSLSSLERIKGQLRYLKGLAVSKDKVKDVTCPSHQPDIDQDPSLPSAYSTHERDPQGKADDDLCPICHEKLASQKMVFQCGHATCCKCCLEMTEHALGFALKCKKKWVMCPTCRQHTDFRNIAYVDDKLSKVHNSEASSIFEGQFFSKSSLKVEGSYGTKIEAIIRRILLILSTEPDAKILVFSSWNDVLNLLEHAFHDNSISYIRMKGGRKSQVAIELFKGAKIQAGPTGPPSSVQVMLLLIQHGANGLNILEAQHVILVEPLLNPAAEAQAINRVHRIGQDKKTYVHRFIVNGTVEESIHNLNRNKNPRSVISSSSKGQDQPALTLKDIETLLQAMPRKKGAEEGSSQVLPAAVAAAMAAERRLMEGNTTLQC